MQKTKFWGDGAPAGNTNTSSVSSMGSSPKAPVMGGKGVKIFKGLGLGFVFVAIIGGLVGFAFVTYVVQPSYLLQDSVQTLKLDVEDIQKQLLNRDLVELTKALDKTESDLKTLQTLRDEKFGWAKDFSYFNVSTYYKDSEHFITAGYYSIDAMREAMRLAEPFADAAGLRVSEEQAVVNNQTQGSGLPEALQAWLRIMPEISNNIDELLLKLDKVGNELNQVNADIYPSDFRGMDLQGNIRLAQDVFGQVSQAAPDIKAALRLIPDLMGVGTPEKRYMIIMQNDKEIRGPGGFWTYIATFKLRDGLLSSDFTSYNSYYVDDVLNVIDAYHTFPKVPATYERHLKVERMFARDANISPDLPTAVDNFMTNFWKLAMPIAPNQIKSVSGVAVIDTNVVAELLEVTGPVTVNGVTFSQDNVVYELERIASLTRQEQVDRKKILGDLMEAMLVNVFESERNLWTKLVDKGVDLTVRKHAAGVILDNPEAQALLERYNFSNRIVDPVEGDYAFAAQTNLGGDKTNWFVKKQVNHKLEKEADSGKWLKTVTIKYDYKTPQDPQLGVFIKRFRDWMRLYVPKGSQLVSVTGSEDPEGTGEERNKTYFHGFVTLGPDESKELVFKYYLPDGVVKQDGTYNLYLQKQSGIVSETHTVEVNGTKETIELTTDMKITKKVN